MELGGKTQKRPYGAWFSMEKTRKDRGGYGELTAKDCGDAEQAEAARSLAQRTARRRHGFDGAEWMTMVLRSAGDGDFHQVMLGNLLGSMERLPTMVTATVVGDWLLGEIRRKQDGDASARAMLH